MSSIPNLEAYLGAILACTSGAVTIGTPVLWRMLRRRPRPARLLWTSLGSVAMAGLAGLVVEGFRPIVYEIVAALSMVLAMLLQILVVPILLILSRPRAR